MTLTSQEPNEEDRALEELLLARIATDDGSRIDLDDIIETFGFNREELEQELADDMNEEYNQ